MAPCSVRDRRRPVGVGVVDDDVVAEGAGQPDGLGAVDAAADDREGRRPAAASVSAASTPAAAVRSAVTAAASSRATSAPVAASESRTTPDTVGRPLAGLPGNEVTHLSRAWPPPSAGIARKSPAG